MEERNECSIVKYLQVDVNFSQVYDYSWKLFPVLNVGPQNKNERLLCFLESQYLALFCFLEYCRIYLFLLFLDIWLHYQTCGANPYYGKLEHEQYMEPERKFQTFLLLFETRISLILSVVVLLSFCELFMYSDFLLCAGPSVLVFVKLLKFFLFKIDNLKFSL